MDRTEWVAIGVAALAGILFGLALGKRHSEKMLSRARQTRVTPDGWCVSRPYWKVVRFIVEHQPPRPALWFQLRIDATSAAPIALWLSGLDLIVLGVGIRWWGGVGIGVWVLAIYVLMLWTNARHLRDSPAALGVIGALKPYGRSKYASTATAITADGQAVQICVPTSLVSEITDRGERAQVLFLNNPQIQPCMVFAARALPSQPPAPETNVGEYANSSSNSPDSSHTC